MIIESQNLTPAARVALVDTHFRAGSPLPRGTSFRATTELATYGLIGSDGNLSRDGAIVRARIIDQALEAMEP
jgi:hypothetical protein